jgi:putative ABC transport system permease protein
MGTLFQDLRFSLRMLLKSPGFATVAVLSLALGIGANTTIFSVINALLYRSLPYEHADRLMVIWQTEQAHPDSQQAPPIAEVVDWKKQNHVFEDIALTSFTETATLAGLGEAEVIRVQYVTPNFFGLLGAKPTLGRIFLPEEVQDRTQAVIVSTSFWKRRFAADPKVLGKAFSIDGVLSTVVGVMPAGFAPFYGGRIDLWEPINPERARYSQRQDHWLMPVGRIKAGITLQQAQVEMDVIARRLEQAYPTTNKGVGKKVVPLHDVLYGWAGRALYPLLGAVAFVLLIACANVANLLQSRTETRRKEYAVRASLGASRRRLMQQLLAESGLLALAGGALGVILSFWGIQLFVKLAGDFPNAENLTVDVRVLLFALAVSLMTAILFGLAPAIQASNPNLNVTLKEGGRRTAAGSRGLTRRMLAVSEVALAMVLLVGAGLMINTLLRLQQVDPGFDSKNIVTMEISVPEGGKYLERVPGGHMEKASPLVTVFHQQLLEKAALLPGVESVGLTSGVPTHWAEQPTFSVLGHPAPPPDKRPETGYYEVSAGFFRTLRIPLKKGRYLDEHDTATTPWVIDINEAFARRYFPNEEPIGQQLLLRYEPDNQDEERPRQIVGIVGNVKHYGLNEEAPPFVYASHLQQPAAFPGGRVMAHLRQDLVIRTASALSGGRVADLGASVKKLVAETDPDVPVTGTVTMDEIFAGSVGIWRFYMRLLEIFAGIALLLAVIGIYGVMSYFVADRTHEIGIRVALGAQRADVLRLVTKQGLRLTLIGVAVGVVLALALTRLIATFLFGVRPTDPLTFAAVAIGLTGVALVACYLPARRATKVDPMVALRYE